VQGDRQRERPDQQTERIFDLLQAGGVRFVIVAIRLRCELSLADDSVEDKSDNERREDKQNDYWY
jgi:hypothetical protein